VFLVGKDFGASPAYLFSILHPERVLGVITLGVPYAPPGPGPSMLHKYLPEGFYMLRWKVNIYIFSFWSFTVNYTIIMALYPSICICMYQEPGRAEADFGRFDAKTVVRNVYILFSRSELPIANENQEIMDLVEPDTPLPSWFTEEDLSVYGALYEKSGFRTALQVPYRY
jgi:pimeloyl-ACP methyl ester carboxylesterase